MKEFVKDYVELCKDNGRFYKKHWKGVILLNAVIIGAEMAYYQYRYRLVDTFIKNDSCKEEETQ